MPRLGGRTVEQEPAQTAPTGQDEVSQYGHWVSEGKRLNSHSNMDRLILRPATCDQIGKVSTYIQKPLLAQNEKSVMEVTLTGDTGNGKTEVLKGLLQVGEQSGAIVKHIKASSLAGIYRRETSQNLLHELDFAMDEASASIDHLDRNRMATVILAVDEAHIIMQNEADGREVAGVLNEFYEEHMGDRQVKTVVLLATRIGLPADVDNRAMNINMPYPNDGERVKAMLDYIHTNPRSIYGQDLLEVITTIHDDPAKAAAELAKPHEKGPNGEEMRNPYQKFHDVIAISDGWSYRDISYLVSDAPTSHFEDTGKPFTMDDLEEESRLRNGQVRRRIRTEHAQSLGSQGGNDRHRGM